MGETQITGSIRVVASYNPDGSIESMQASWVGGDIVGISTGFLEMTDSQHVQRSGDIVSIMQYRVQIIQANERTYIARRIDDDSHS